MKKAPIKKSTCKDKRRSCPRWAKSGACATKAGMNTYCMFSCKTCHKKKAAAKAIADKKAAAAKAIADKKAAVAKAAAAAKATRAAATKAMAAKKVAVAKAAAAAKARRAAAAKAMAIKKAALAKAAAVKKTAPKKKTTKSRSAATRRAVLLKIR